MAIEASDYVGHELIALRLDLLTTLTTLDRLILEHFSQKGLDVIDLRENVFDISVAGEKAIFFHTTTGFIYPLEGKPVRLSLIESLILGRLVDNPNELVTVRELYQAGWPDEVYDESPEVRKENERVNTVMGRLRKKLRRVSPLATEQIESSKGQGYVWKQTTVTTEDLYMSHFDG